MDAVQKLWDKALLAANENYNAEQATGEKNTAENGGVQYFKAGDKHSKSIKEQIAEHSEDLNAKSVVASIRVSDMPKGDIQKQRRWAENRLKSTGYAVDRKGTGKIEFTPSQLNTGLNYLDEPGEIAAFAELPAVLKRGDIIDQHDEHKGRQRGSMTIAAPVEINGVRGNMAVALTETTSRHYHTHRIVMPDGSTFVFNENEDAESKPAGELPAKQALIAEPINSTSDDTIAQRREESNTPNRQFQMFENVEETDRLVAVHNKSVSDLRRMLQGIKKSSRTICSPRRRGGDGENRTPVRKRFLRNFSGRRRLFAFPCPCASRHARGLGSFMMHGTLKALRTHGPHSSTPLSGPWASRERRSRDYAARRTVLSLFFNL